MSAREKGELRVGKDFYLQKKRIGRGSFGSIYLGRNINSGDVVAIKLVFINFYITYIGKLT